MEHSSSSTGKISFPIALAKTNSAKHHLDSHQFAEQRTCVLPILKYVDKHRFFPFEFSCPLSNLCSLTKEECNYIECKTKFIKGCTHPSLVPAPVLRFAD